MALRIAIVGYGSIARSQHEPAIAGEPEFALAAVVSPSRPGPPGVRCFASHQAMLEAMPELDAVAVCTPPGVRYEVARDCIAAGCHALLEKPPGISLGEVEALARLAAEREVSLFTTWHAQENPAVAEVRSRLSGRRVRTMRVRWEEDVRKWHPGQQWIWQPGGFGVFDTGINALSIATHVFPGTLIVRAAELLFPSNRQTPIAATLELASPAATGSLTCEFDWRHKGGECWSIGIETEDGECLCLSEGGSHLAVDGKAVVTRGREEYPALYRRFAGLIRGGESQVDLAPLRLVADAFLLGHRGAIEPFLD